MENTLQQDKGGGNGIQAFKPGVDTFETITDGVSSVTFSNYVELIIIHAVTDLVYVYGDNPAVPADLDSGHFLPEGQTMPVIIPGGNKLAVKGTAKISW